MTKTDQRSETNGPKGGYRVTQNDENDPIYMRHAERKIDKKSSKSDKMDKKWTGLTGFGNFMKTRIFHRRRIPEIDHRTGIFEKKHFQKGAKTAILGHFGHFGGRRLDAFEPF